VNLSFQLKNSTSSLLEKACLTLSQNMRRFSATTNSSSQQSLQLRKSVHIRPAGPRSTRQALTERLCNHLALLFLDCVYTLLNASLDKQTPDCYRLGLAK